MRRPSSSCDGGVIRIVLSIGQGRTPRGRSQKARRITPASGREVGSRRRRSRPQLTSGKSRAPRTRSTVPTGPRHARTQSPCTETSYEHWDFSSYRRPLDIPRPSCATDAPDPLAPAPRIRTSAWPALGRLAMAARYRTLAARWCDVDHISTLPIGPRQAHSVPRSMPRQRITREPLHLMSCRGVHNTKS